MPQILFIAKERFEGGGLVEFQAKWGNFLASVEQILPNAIGVERLSSSTFLLDTNNGLAFLQRLLALTATYHVESRVLFFDKPPAWIVTKS